MSGRGVNGMPGRPQGEGSARIEGQELEEAGRRHEIDRGSHAHDAHRGGFFSRLVHRRLAGKKSDAD